MSKTADFQYGKSWNGCVRALGNYLCREREEATMHPLMMHFLVLQLLTIVSDQTYVQNQICCTKKRLSDIFMQNAKPIKFVAIMSLQWALSRAKYFSPSLFHHIRFSWFFVPSSASRDTQLLHCFITRHGLNDFNEMNITKRRFLSLDLCK